MHSCPSSSPKTVLTAGEKGIEIERVSPSHNNLSYLLKEPRFYFLIEVQDLEIQQGTKEERFIAIDLMIQETQMSI